MKIFQSLMLISSVTLLVTGCDDSSSNSPINQPLSGVYSGVNKDDDGNLLQAQIINEVGQTPLISFWDDRDHQTSYSGKVESSGNVVFNSVQYECDIQSSSVTCDSPVGSIVLKKENMPLVSLSDYVGTYQANWDDSLYRMEVGSDGKVNITNGQCHAQGVITLSNDIDNLHLFSITQDDCGAGNVLGYSQLDVDNESLYSINIQTDNENFPQVWVKQ